MPSDNEHRQVCDLHVVQARPHDLAPARAPAAVPLRRYEPGQPLLVGPAYVDAAPGGRVLNTILRVLDDAGAEVRRPPAPDGDERYGALVLDASGIAHSEDLRHVHAALSPVIRRIAANGRLLVLGTPPEACEDPRAAAAQRALDGFARAAAKELGRAATGQLVQVEPGAEENAESTLRFLLSARSAYVSGQVVRVGAGAPETAADWARAARRPGRGRHRRGARHRRGNRRHAGPRRRAGLCASTSRPRGRRWRRPRTASAAPRSSSTSPARTPPPRWHSTCASATAAPTSSSTMPASPATRRSGG